MRRPRQEIRLLRVRGANWLWEAWIQPNCRCPGWYLRNLGDNCLYASRVYAQAKRELEQHRDTHTKEN